MGTAAIYARKSVETDKGESIENQISRGIALCQLQGWDYVIYQDYGISGKSLDRPDFERMMRDIRSGKINYVVCYKIDRISRSVSDFSSFVDELSALGVGFICIRDNFDTTTPMGRAMMMITSVFAQLERETIAERVKDNMVDRAKLGKWNGGPVPIGYIAESQSLDVDGQSRKKKASKLVVSESEADIVRLIYHTYLKDKSIRAIPAMLNREGIPTKNGSLWEDTQVSRVLRNPLYCIADQTSYEYFAIHTDVQIIHDKKDFDGTHGLMYYNRRKEHNKTSTKLREESDWMLCIGEHHGIISGEDYVRVQNQLKNNKAFGPRSKTSKMTPLPNVRCGVCGYAMSVYYARNNPSSPYIGYFRCNKKERLQVECSNRNVRIDILENKVISNILELYRDEKFIAEALNASNLLNDERQVHLISERQKLYYKLDEYDREMKNLVAALGKQTLPEIVIQERYKELQKEKNICQNEINRKESDIETISTEVNDIEAFIKNIGMIKDSYNDLNIEERRELLNEIIKEIRVTSSSVEVDLLITSALSDPAFCSHTDMDLQKKLE